MTLVQKFPTDYADKLGAYQRHVSSLCQKHDYLQGQMENAEETPVLFNMPTYTIVDVKRFKTHDSKNHYI